MKQKRRPGIAFTIICAILLSQAAFAVMVQAIGAILFTNSFKKEYATSTYYMANTAAALINGDHLDGYAAGEAAEEYELTRQRLDVYCRKMHVSLLYVICVDTSDYGRFVSIFNSVDNTVDNTSYTEWELGFRRDTTNDEYRKKYRAMYEKTAPYETVYRTTRLNGHNPHITTMVPVSDSAGNTVGILCIQRPMRELRDAYRPYLVSVAVWAMVSCAVTGALAAFYIRRQFLRPIQKTADEAIRFARENTKGEPLGKISRLREIDDLAGAIDTMESDMLTYIENLTSVTAEKERIGAELSLASTIQENSIPNIFPPFPDRTEFDIYASMTPAKEVGGDFYNFFLIDDDHLAMVIGDVSGKGVPAALFMMVTNILLSDRTHMGGTPGEILTYVNRNLCEHNKADMFVTLWLGILEISTGKVVFANAGHEDAAVCSKDGAFALYKTRHGFVAGGMQGIKFRDFELQLQPGDKLFLYTDGVPEATDGENRMFGMDRTLDALNANREKTPQEILEGVHGSVDAFVGEAPQFDDLTMLCLHYIGADKKNDVHELTVDATPGNLGAVTEFIDGVLQEAGCPMKTQMQIDLAVEEIFVNIAHYAYEQETGKATVLITLGQDPRAAHITFLDSGKPYDPLGKKDPDITASAEERKIGGLGVFLVKKTMDNVQYVYRDGRNILSFQKNL